MKKCVQNNRCVILSKKLSDLDDVPIHNLEEKDYHLVHSFKEIVYGASPPSHVSDMFYLFIYLSIFRNEYFGNNISLWL